MWNRTTLAETADPAGIERSGLPADAEIAVRAIRSGNATLYEAALRHPVGSHELLEWCNAASKQRPFYREDVLADWDAPDDPDWPLHALHNRMGPPWEIFQSHRKALAALLRTPDRNDILLNVVGQRTVACRPEQEALCIAENDLEATDLLRRRADAYLHTVETARALDRPTVDAVEQKIRRRWAHHVRKHPGQRKDIMHRPLRGFDNEKLRVLVSRIANALGKARWAEVERAAEAGRRQRADDVLRKRFVPFDGAYVDARDKRYLDRQGARETDDHYLEFSWKHGKRRGSTLYADIRRAFNRKTSMGALVRWEKDETGARSMKTEPVDGERQEEWKREVGAMDHLTEPATMSPMLGVLAVAAVEPSITERWPEEMKPTGALRAQYMYAAQIPVLALMFRRQLAASGFIDRLERTARSA